MRIATLFVCAIFAVGLVTGCSERAATPERSDNPPGERSAQSASPPSAGPPSMPPARPSLIVPVKPTFRRWAVVYSKDSPEAALGDLITAELSGVKELQLVEREQLDAVAKELQLAAVAEPQAASTRLKMGQLLKADALLMISLEQRQKDRVLKVVVSECRCGARLRIGYLPYDGISPADLSHACAEVVVKICEHFPGGIRQIVGVSPLLSKTLVHDYDHLQTVFARILEAGLLEIPNVAVIEIEEARAIGREASLDGSKLQDRPTPLLVEGEYTVSRNGQGKPEVQFQFISQGAGGRRPTIRPPSMPLSATPQFLVNDLPRQLLSTSGGAPVMAVSPEEQSRWLAERAAAFAQLGAGAQEIELLEAALLLLPDDFSLRAKLLAGYCRYVDSRVMWLWNGRSKEEVQANMPKLVEAFLSYRGHVEYLIRNRRLNGYQALHAAGSLPESSYWELCDIKKANDASDPALREARRAATEAKHRFMTDVFPQILQLSIEAPKENHEFFGNPRELVPRSGDAFYKAWLRSLVGSIVAEKNYGRDQTPQDLDYVFRLLTEIVPDRWGTPETLVRFLEGYDPRISYTIVHTPDQATDADWQAFYGRLAASKHHMASLWGRYALLQRKSEQYSRTQSRKLGESLLAETDSWLKECAAMAAAAPKRAPNDREPIIDSANALRNSIHARLNPRTDFVVGAPPKITKARQEVELAVAKLKFEDIALQGFSSDGFNELLACGKDCDLLWQENAVALIRKKGVAHEILQFDTRFQAVHWDGRQVWIATSGQAIWVLSLEGKISKIGPDQGLPPADRGLLLHVLAPGKVCAAGSFGEHNRAWCAIVEFGQNGAKVNVFYHATHVPPNRLPLDNDPEQVFIPRFFYNYDPGNGAAHVLLLHRGLGSRTPLLSIDPATLQVSEFTDLTFPQFPFSERYVNLKGEMLGMEPGNEAVLMFARPGGTLDDGQSIRPLVIEYPEPEPGSSVERSKSPGYQGVQRGGGPRSLPVRGSKLLPYNGAIYVPPGRFASMPGFGGNRGEIRWFRIDPVTFRAEVLASGLTRAEPGAWYGVSNHYGLVGGCRATGRSPARFFRVIVENLGKDGAAPAQQTVAARESETGRQRFVLVASSDDDPPPIAGPATSQAEMRTWTSARGRFQVLAQLVEASTEAVVLDKEGGARVRVPRANLSQADRDYLDQRASAASRADQRPIGKGTIPGADNPSAFTSNDFCKRRLEYGARIYREAYLQVGKKDPAWDAAALALLDAVAKIEAYRDLPAGWACDKPSAEQVRALARAAREKGCDDPLVLGICACALTPTPWSPEVAETTVRALDELRQRRYPPVHVANLACKIVTFSTRQENKIVTALIDGLADAACAWPYEGIDRRFVLKAIQDDLAPFPGGIQQLAGKVAARGDADPWLESMLSAIVEIGLGLQERNSDSFAPGARNQPQGPGGHWQAAERLLVKARVLHRDYPESAALMILLSDLSSAPEQVVRLWFDRATAAQFDWTPAYIEMGRHLLNRGGADAVYAFGVECLKTGRFDTDVPCRFLVFLDEIRRQTQSVAYLRRPEVYANIREFFRGNAQDSRNKNMDFFSSEEAVFACCAENFPDARASLEKVGNRLDKRPFMGTTRDPEAAIARVYALSGPLSAETLAMEKAADSGQTEKVLQTCRQVLEKLDRADKARPYFRARLVASEIETRFATGQWVPIQPDADLAGWTARCGHWSVDDQGRLAGTWVQSDPCAAILLCHAKINPNFELTGHAEVVDSGRWAGFGTVLSYQSTKSFWECIFYPPLTGDPGETAFIARGNRAYVRCVDHDNRHERAAKVGRSDDFRVQVFDGSVASTVGAEIQQESPPRVVELDHDPPSGDMPFGVCVNRGLLSPRYTLIASTKLDVARSGINIEPPARSETIVRFTGLKVRKLAKPPVQARRPRP